MNITCDSCHARYTIPDEKVTGEGRVFKVPCKQCGAEIVVEGIPETAAGTADDGAGQTADAWYYAVGQDRQGPVSRQSLSELIAAGTVTSSTYVWCDGMEDWSVLGETDELKALLAPTETVVSESAPADDASQSAHDEETTDATPSPSATDEPESSDDLFSFETTEKAPRSSVHGRRDSSVLFSLDELSSFEEPREQDPQSFLTETSGLIDIRGLANSHQTRADDADNPFLSATAGASSSKPAFSLSHVPVVAKKKSPWPLVAGIAVILAIGVGVTLAVVGGDADGDSEKTPKGDSVAAATVEAGGPAAAASSEAAATKKPGTSATSEKGAEAKAASADDDPKVAKVDEPSAAAAGAEKVDAAPDGQKAPVESKGDKSASKAPVVSRKVAAKASKASARKKPTRVVAKKAASPKPAAPVKPVAPKEAPVERKNASKGVNDLLSSLSGKKAAKKTEGAGGGSGPKTLTSSTVRSKVGARKSRFKSCYKMQPNRPPTGVSVTLKFTIKNTGSVGSARVNGGGLTGGVQSCILRALKSLRFPVFRDPEKRVTYPLRLL